MQVTFKLSPAVRQSVLITKGEALPEKVTRSIPLIVLDEPTRRLIAIHNPDVQESFGLYLPGIVERNGQENTFGDNSLYAASFYPTTDDDWSRLFHEFDIAYQARRREQEHEREERLQEIVKELRGYLEKDTPFLPYNLSSGIPRAFKETSGFDEALQLYRQLTQQVDQHKAQMNEVARQARLSDELKQATEAAEKAQREQDKREWIAAHGSDYLKKCVQEDYDCQRPYVLERATREYPDFTVDFENEADWKDRSSPTPSALEEAIRVKGLVVWLTSPPRARPVSYLDVDWPEGDFHECEAIVIRGFLGKYDLIKTM